VNVFENCDRANNPLVRPWPALQVLRITPFAAV